MIEWPEQLIKDIARRRAVIVLGSGISKNSQGKDGVRPPTWREFLEEAFAQVPPKSRHITYAFRSGDYLSACAFIKSRMEEKWDPFLISRFLTPAFKPNKMHELIFALDTGIYITPNFDKIFDNYVTERTHGTTVVKTYYDNDVQQLLRSGGRLIVKIHGTIDAPGRMIFTRGDYAQARVEYSAFYHLMDALLLTNTFLILGSGLNDPDSQLLFENFSYRFPKAPPHYMTYADEIHNEFDDMIRETRKLRMLKYSKTNGHKELEESLASLGKKVEEERQRLAASLSW